MHRVVVRVCTWGALWLSLCAVGAHGGSSYRSGLRLVDGGYEGLIVGISDALPQEHCNQVLHGLKSLLTEFSQKLWKATGERVSLRDVTVNLPDSWQTDVLTCSLLSPLTRTSVMRRPQILVSGPHPVFGSQPWVQQSQGCGKMGDFIQLGADLLRGTSSDGHNHTARLLLSEWVKFRWGIFDERGYKGDPLYPEEFRDPVTGELRPNQCHQTSTDLPFCAAADHVPEAPTKHNAQCTGRAAWNVISQSADFNDRKKSNSSTTALFPSIKFVQSGPPRIIIAAENTAVMNLQKRWEFIRKAVRRVIVYDVPDGAHVGFVVFNSVATATAPSSKMEEFTDVRQRIGSSVPRNPSHIPESHKCLLCALQEALRALDADSSGTTGATVILITTGSGTTPQNEIDEMIRLANMNYVRVEIILYPSIGNQAVDSSKSDLQRLASATDGTVFTVMDEGVGNDSKMSMMIGLMDSLLAAIRRTAKKSSLLVHSKTYPGGYNSIVRGKFSLDDSLSKATRFSVFYYDLNHVGNTIQLTTPSGKVMASINMQEEDGDANVIFVTIPSAERGEWQYQVENRADSHQGLHIQVTAVESNTRQTSLRVWTSQSNTDDNSTELSMPVIIYADIKDSRMPVLKAKVEAKLQRLGTNATGSRYEPIFLDLYDNGFGDPDVTNGDGVYSRYLPIAYLEGLPGQFEMTVSADDNNGLAVMPVSNHLSRYTIIPSLEEEPCCGSNIHYSQVKSLMPFQRSEVYGVLGIKSSSTENDNIPPARILDLRTSVNISSYEVTLRWTAPGDDYDWGRAHHYEAVYASSWVQAKSYGGNKISGMPEPASVGTEQFVTIMIDRYDQIVYFSIYAVDEFGNRGGISNIGSVWIPHPPTTVLPLSIDDILNSAQGFSEPQDRGVTQPIRVAGFLFQDMSVIIGSVTGLVIVIVVIILVCFIHLMHKKRRQQKREAEKRVESNPNIIIKSNSNLVIDQEDSHDSADSAIKDIDTLVGDGRPLSPNLTWTASKLLHEHENRLSTPNIAQIETADSNVKYQSLQGPFPDVTLTGSYPSSQTSSQAPSTIQSDPPAYQPQYTGTEYPSSGPYSYSHGYSQEHLASYSSQQGLLSLQPTMSSEMYQQEIADIYQREPLSHVSYGHEVPNYVGEMTGYVHTVQPPPMYAAYSENVPRTPGTSRSKVPPPVAPKPPRATCNTIVASISATALEPKRRNVTQV
ncbi:unnamed protein product [Meganyctiphanes norvegica]|uniref:VWFA domain-containing protein n=1 Tax=Meganyctiphanes norvegica TaxID=48144 RepID=A0AAV2S7N1_MEGNR